MTVKELLNKYNSMLKEKHGQRITVRIKKVPRENKYYFTSRKYGESVAFDTIKEAYKEADCYLHGVGEWW